MFGYEPPYPLTYEWISLKGVGAMSSSTGITIGPMDVLELVPSEILRYLIARSKPSKHLEFNTGELLLNLADEYERTCQSVNSPDEVNIEDLSSTSSKYIATFYFKPFTLIYKLFAPLIMKLRNIGEAQRLKEDEYLMKERFESIKEGFVDEPRCINKKMLIDKWFEKK